MSTSTEPQKYEWLVILPDQAGALPRRMEVRQQHLQNLQTYPPDFWLWGGGFLEDVPKEGEPMKMLGSAMLAWASSKEEVLEKLKKDVYTENRVWDWEKVQIYPFKSAIRKPL
ncbi:Dimeric alpha-beta barrel [Macrophomina phaseolina MS6]|uniref:Dimeric alpha-beta barrel n=1 Tax=Macrophomina phaseolina (strain MS6) TaxID=1126212 RepID=K2S380_MACPH|nr:Dimeric alpha-beta barrel [Macrophomina phaseolina MS6]